MWAAVNGHVEVVRLLLDAGAEKAQGWMKPGLQNQVNWTSGFYRSGLCRSRAMGDPNVRDYVSKRKAMHLQNLADGFPTINIAGRKSQGG